LNFQISVPGKLILLGEYAVLNEADALVMAIDRNAVISIKQIGADHKCRLTSSLESESLYFQISSKGKLTNIEARSKLVQNKMKFALIALEQICTLIIKSGKKIHPFYIHLDTTQYFIRSIKMGLGSSAALTVGIIRAVSHYTEMDQRLFSGKIELFMFANKIHQIMQGNRGSGIDIAASVYQDTIIYNSKIPARIETVPIKLDKMTIIDLYLLPIWTGVPASTPKLLTNVQEYSASHPDKYNTFIKSLSELSNQGCHACRSRNQSQFLDIVQKFYNQLLIFSEISDIPIISDIHKKIADIVYHNGGVYKPSGAGMGDLGISFCKSLEIKNKVESELKNENIECIHLKPIQLVNKK
jgi:phosphomevalonate kinase